MFLSVLMAFVALVQESGPTTPAARAQANLATYFSTDDYPPSALARGAEGTVRFQLEIGPDGLVKKCDIVSSSGDPALDAATCSIVLGRARYAPARDAAGRPVIGRDVASVTWRLPSPSQGMPFARFAMVSRLVSNGTGELSCTITREHMPETVVGPNSCGHLADSGASELLRRVPVPMEVTLISVAGPENSGVEAMGANEAVFGDLQYDEVTEFVVDQNGRVGECRSVSRNIPPSSLLGDRGEPCERPAREGSPLFAPAPDAAPRRARFRSALYIKGWPEDLEFPPPPAPLTPNAR